jgi:DNA replication protein DnaD
VSPESEITGGLDPGFSTLTDNGARNLTDAYIDEGQYSKNSISHLLSKINQFNTIENNNDNNNNNNNNNNNHNNDNVFNDSNNRSVALRELYRLGAKIPER